jgi:hypothetical protein
MAQARTPKQENEPSAATSPEQPFEQVTEQMRGLGEKAAAQMSKSEEQLRKFGEQARDLNEQIVESATKVGQDALQRYVDWLQTIAEEQRKLASSPQVSEMDWFASMLKAQADFTQEFAKMVGGMTSFGQQPQG